MSQLPPQPSSSGSLMQPLGSVGTQPPISSGCQDPALIVRPPEGELPKAAKTVSFEHE